MNYLTTVCRIGVASLTAFGFVHNISAYSDEQEIGFDSDAEIQGRIELCICKGLSYMFEQNPVDARSQFEQALLFKQQLHPEWNETDFLITFCKLITCDQLGLKQECSSLQHLLSTSLTGAFFEDASEEISITNKESLEASEFLNRLTTLAPSQNVQQVLRSMIAGSLSRSFQSNSFDQDTTQQQSSSTSKFIKRWAHILKKTREILQLLNECKIIFKEIF